MSINTAAILLGSPAFGTSVLSVPDSGLVALPDKRPPEKIVFRAVNRRLRLHGGAIGAPSQVKRFGLDWNRMHRAISQSASNKLKDPKNPKLKDQKTQNSYERLIRNTFIDTASNPALAINTQNNSGMVRLLPLDGVLFKEYLKRALEEQKGKMSRRLILTLALANPYIQKTQPELGLTDFLMKIARDKSQADLNRMLCLEDASVREALRGELPELHELWSKVSMRSGVKARSTAALDHMPPFSPAIDRDISHFRGMTSKHELDEKREPFLKARNIWGGIGTLALFFVFQDGEGVDATDLISLPLSVLTGGMALISHVITKGFHPPPEEEQVDMLLEYKQKCQKLIQEMQDFLRFDLSERTRPLIEGAVDYQRKKLEYIQKLLRGWE